MRWGAAQGTSAEGAPEARIRGRGVSEGAVCDGVRGAARQVAGGRGRREGRTKVVGVWSARLLVLVLGAPQRRGTVGGRTTQAADKAGEPGLQCGASGGERGKVCEAQQWHGRCHFCGACRGRRGGAYGGRAGACRGLQRRRGAGWGRGHSWTALAAGVAWSSHTMMLASTVSILLATPSTV